MIFQTIASGSRGNCYTLMDGKAQAGRFHNLMLEAGLNEREVRRKNFLPSASQGCLITHSHADHAKGVPSLLKSAVDCYMSAGTAEELGVSGHRVHIIKSLNQFKIGGWTILPFETVHDTKEPLGFLIQAPSGDKLLFATDTGYVKYRFKGINVIAIECNFDEDTVRQAVLEKQTDPSAGKRLYGSHMSLQAVKRMLLANDLSMVREIHLLHLSDGHSDEKRFRDDIEKLTGKPTFVGQSL